MQDTKQSAALMVHLPPTAFEKSKFDWEQVRLSGMDVPRRRQPGGRGTLGLGSPVSMG